MGSGTAADQMSPLSKLQSDDFVLMTHKDPHFSCSLVCDLYLCCVELSDANPEITSIWVLFFALSFMCADAHASLSQFSSYLNP